MKIRIVLTVIISILMFVSCARNVPQAADKDHTKRITSETPRSSADQNYEDDIAFPQNPMPSDQKKSEQVSALINDRNLIIGGTINGLWVDASEISKYLNENQQYCLYAMDVGRVNTVYGSSLKEEGFFTGDTGFYMHLGKNSKVFDFGLTGDFDPFPRSIASEKPNAKHKELVTRILHENGKENNHVVINNVYLADLDNDGMSETIISAEYISDDDSEIMVQGGEEISGEGYSFIVLLSNVEGVQKEFLLAGDFTGWISNRIAFIGDIDNDKNMEIMLEQAHFGSLSTEGLAIIDNLIYEFKNNSCKETYSFTWHPFLDNDFKSIDEASRFLCPEGARYLNREDIWGNGKTIILNFGDDKNNTIYSALLFLQENKYPYECNDEGKMICPIKIAGHSTTYLIWEDQYSLIKISKLAPDDMSSYDENFPSYYFYANGDKNMICNDLSIKDLDSDGTDELILTLVEENNSQTHTIKRYLKWNGSEFVTSSEEYQ